MSDPKYKKRHGSRIKGNIDEIGKFMAALYKKHRGKLEPETVVNVARPKDSPIHGCFEWRDSKAAEEWRLHQARNLIIGFAVYNEERETYEQEYIHVKGPEVQTYRRVIDAMANKTEREIVLEQAKREAKAFRMKYARLKELSDVFEAIDRLP